MLLNTAPGGGYTGLHKDGMGTVDSGHSVATGFNEVVMLRRTNESDTIKAKKILYAQSPLSQYNGDEPHGDGQGDGHPWPTKDIIRQLAEAG